MKSLATIEPGMEMPGLDGLPALVDRTGFALDVSRPGSGGQLRQRGTNRRILDSNWWNAPEPAEGLERRIWRCRAAFLDVRFYEPGA